jgi:GTP cyclohydrolase I
MNYIDYSAQMPHLNFKYDENYYPEDKDVPDPQIDPVIPGARVPINKVGVSGVDLPVNFIRRDGSVEKLTTSVSLYGSLDNPNAKGLNLSRFPIVMHEQIADHVSIDGITHILDELQRKQGSKDVYCKMKFKYPWTQKALRTRKELPGDAPDEQVFKVVDGVKLSHEKMEGYIYYNCVLEGQKHDQEYKFFLTVDYVYSSTCPC